jgi:PTS system nitrogen regulatory IIA component
MQLTVRDVARIFNVSEAAVYRWVSAEDLPAEQVNGQYRFNRTELLEWATLRKREVSPALFHGEGEDAGPPRLDEALAAGGIVHGLGGPDRPAVLGALVEAMRLPPEADRDFLLEVLLSRESLGSTGVGGGLAIPHPRYPLVLPVPRPLATLCFLDRPIPYGAPDGQPVHTLFALVCPTARLHLQLLARLALALRDPGFRGAVEQKAPAETILREARRLEEALHRPDEPPRPAGGQP